MPCAEKTWNAIREETAQQVQEEPILASFLHATILNHDTFEDALSYHLANKLDSPAASSMLIREVILEALNSDPNLSCAAIDDINAILERDSACDSLSTPFLFLKGFTLCNHTAWLTGCGITNGANWLYFCRTAIP